MQPTRISLRWSPRSPGALLLILPFVIALANPLRAADEEERTPLDPALLASLEGALADPDPRAHIDALWGETIRAHGTPEPLIEECEARLKARITDALTAAGEEGDPDLATPEIVALRRITARVARILGDLTRARDLVVKIPEDQETLADILEKAQILDALGKNEEALGHFARVLEREIDPELRSAVLLRRALLVDPKKTRTASSGGGSSAMAGVIPATPIGAAPALPSTPAVRISGPGGTFTFAGGDAGSAARGSSKDEDEPPSPLALFAIDPERTPELANRAAMILGLRGEQSHAIEAFQVEDGEGSHRFRQEIRLAEWALEAEEWARAQEFGWAAVRSAKMKRDRRYALTILVEAYRRDRALDALIDRFATAADLSEESRQVWIDLLRETGRVEEALALFRSGGDGEFTIDMRRELLEMCRETGQEEILVSAYQKLIEEEPRFIEWREGLSRSYLERGDRERALAVWDDYLTVTDDLRYRMAAANTLMAIGLDERATAFARACEAMGPEARNGALLFLFELNHTRSRMDDARAMLEELADSAAATDPVHKDVSDAYARLGDKERAVAILSDYRAAKGEDSNPDTDMKLALLLSDIGKEEEALELWTEIWRAVESIPRRRYVEERIMSVAARLGKLATIAVRIERKLRDGTADDREVGLLVRLYTHVKDPVSATEIVEVHWKNAGRKPTDVLSEKARIFVACEDFYNYELVVEELIALDPENRGDYLRQLAMSKLESGERGEARKILERLKNEDADTASLEFEAGVLSIAGLREEALAAYRRSLAEHPERIDTYLLLSNLQKELGRHDRSAGMFQFLAETAEKDDLFTIAIDGILNMRDGRANTGAPDRLVEWGRRIVLERISRRPDKLYLYRLLADLSEELEDDDGAIRALKMALPIAGEQRTPILRELMALATPGRSNRFPGMGVSHGGNEPEIDNTEQLMFGRRLLGQGELVPPQVYLELGEAFLRSREVVNATKTFQRMSQLPEYGEMQRQIAEAFETARYPKDALRIYEQVLTVEPTDVALLTKVGELHEQLGRDDFARELYQRGLHIVLSRRPERKTVNKDEDAPEPARPNWFANRNVDASEEFYPRLVSGVISTIDPEGIDPLLDEVLAGIETELAGVVGDAPTPDLLLEEFPRLEGRLAAYRVFVEAFRRSERTERLDRRLLAIFPDDESLLEGMVRMRIGAGYVVAARRLLEETDRPAKEKQKLALLVGGAREEDLPGVVPVSEASALILPLLIDERTAAVTELLNRLDLSTGEKDDMGRMPLLLSTALFLEDAELVLSLCRHYLNLMIQHNPGMLYSGVQTILQKSGMALDETQRRSLIEQIVDAINENPDKFSSFVSRLPDLQKEMGGELFTGEQVEKLIDKRLEANDQFIWGIPQMFSLLPSEERAPIARRIWPRLPKAQTAMFAIQFIPVLEEKVEPSFADFLAEAFRQGVEKADDPNMFQYYADDLIESCGENAEVALRYLEILREREPGDLGYRSGVSVLLAELGRGEEGWVLARELFSERLGSLGGDRDWRVDQAMNRLFETYFEEHASEFLATIDEKIGEAGEDAELERLRLELIARQDDPEAYATALHTAVDRFPDDRDLLQRLLWHHISRGDEIAALGVQQLIVEVGDDDPRQQERAEEQLVRRWRSLRNPVEALALIRAKEEEKAEEDEGAAKKERTPPPSIARVKTALEAGDPTEALRIYRRLWRSFSSGPRNPYRGVTYVMTSSGMMVRSTSSSRRLIWPPDPPTEEEIAERKRKAKEYRVRGGIPDIARIEEGRAEAEAKRAAAKDEDPEFRSAADVLVELEAGATELRRQLRSLRGAQLGSDLAGDIYKALARREAAEVGVEAVLDRMLAREARGEVGKREYGLLFTLIEMSEAVEGEKLAETLAGLLDNLSPTDTTQLRRLARLAAKNGFGERAGILYRWCAVVQPDRSFSYWSSANDLLDEVIEHLEGDERIRTVEAVLAMSDPGEDAFWGREQFELLVLRTWKNLLGEERVLEKARAACESALDLSVTPKRSLAKEAVVLHARAGEIDAALDCLEIALCKLTPPDDLEYSWYRSQFENPGWFSGGDFPTLFPTDASAFEDPNAWYAAVAERVLVWDDEDRLQDGVAFQFLVLATLRQHELGVLDEAALAARLERCTTLAEDEPGNALWLADLRRQVGDEAGAAAIERRLLADGRLHFGRLPEVVARVRETEGPAVALELAEPIARYALEDVFLDEVIAAAEGADRPERAEHWRTMKARAKAAAGELEEIDEERRKAQGR